MHVEQLQADPPSHLPPPGTSQGNNVREQPAGPGSGSGSLRQEPEGLNSPGPARGAGSDPGTLLSPAGDAGRGHRPRAPAPAGRSLPPPDPDAGPAQAPPRPSRASLCRGERGPGRPQNPAWSSGAAGREGSPSAAPVASGGAAGSSEGAPLWGQGRLGPHRRVQLRKSRMGRS